MVRGCARFVLATSLLALTVSAQTGETVTYSYDSLGRLVRVDRGGTVNNGANAAYCYDSADNRTLVTANQAGATQCAASPPPPPPPPAPSPPPPPPSPPPPPPPPPVFSVSGGSADESSNLVFTIVKSGTVTSNFSVSYSTSDGTAAAPGDYGAVNGTATFLPSQTSVTVAVPTVPTARPSPPRR